MASTSLQIQSFNSKYESFGRKLTRVNFGSLSLGVSGITSNSQEEIFITSTNKILRIFKDGSSEIYAGDAKIGRANGPRLHALFDMPQGLHWKEPGFLYVCDTNNSLIRCVEEDRVTTLAGNKAGHNDGPFELAKFHRPRHLVCVGNCLYVTDTSNHRVRVLNLTTHTVSSIGNGDSSSPGAGTFTTASIPRPMSIAIGKTPETLLITSDHSCDVLEVSVESKQVNFQDPAPKLTAPPDTLFCDNFGTTYASVPANDGVYAVLPGGSIGLVCNAGTVKTSTKFVPTICHLSPTGNLYCAERGRSWIWKFTQFASANHISSSLSEAVVRYATPGLLPNHPELAINIPIASLLLNCRPNQVPAMLLRTQVSPCVDLPRTSFTALADVLNGESLVLRQRGSSQSVEEVLLRGLHVAHLLFSIMDHSSSAPPSSESSPGILVWVTAEATRQLLSVPSPILQSSLSAIHATLPESTSFKLIASVLRSRGALTDPASSEQSSTAQNGDSLSDSLRALLISSPKDEEIDSTQVLKHIQALGSDAQLLGCITQMGFESLPWIPSEYRKLPENFTARSSLPEPDMTISIEEDSLQVSVHEWLLYARWPYIAFMMSSGMHESVTKSLQLGDMPKGVLRAILESVYGLSQLTSLSPEDTSYLIENAMQFHLENFEGDPAPAFATLLRKCHLEASAAKE